MKGSHPVRVLYFLLVFSASFIQSVDARVYQLWGGRASLYLPAGFTLTKIGPSYMVLSVVGGRRPRVVSLLISRAIGSDEPNWSSLIRGWNTYLRSDRSTIVIVPPHGRRNNFNVEIAQGFHSRGKIRAIHGPREHHGLRNLYAVHLTAVPGTAWVSPEGQSLLSAFHSIRIKR